MCRELLTAIKLLETRHFKVKVCSFTWIQGESDAQTDAMAIHYQERRLPAPRRHVREILHQPDLPIILGIDEQHPWVDVPIVVEVDTSKLWPQTNTWPFSCPCSAWKKLTRRTSRRRVL